MNRRGIALLGTLWLLAALATVAAGTMTLARLERGASINRIALARGRWAAEGCFAILQGSAGRGHAPAPIDSADLGAGVWCRATIEDPGARVRLDIANTPLLATLVVDPARTAALLDALDENDTPRAEGAERGWYLEHGATPPPNGPFLSVEDLALVRGFDSATVARLRPFLSVRGGTRVNVNAAPVEVLRLVPGIAEGAELIVQRRERGHSIRDMDDLLGGLPANLRAGALGQYAELHALVTFTPERLLLHLEGHVTEAPIVARTVIEVVPATERLAILAREEW